MQPDDRAAALIAGLEGEAQGHDVATPGGLIRWRQFGAGPHLALLHGGHGSWLHWALNIRPLASRYTVWVPDLPGYGDSAAPAEFTLAAIVDATWRSLDALVGDDVPLRLAGFSFGGLVAASLAARRGSVTHLALLGPAGHGGARRPWGELQSWREASQRNNGRELAQVMRHNLQAHMLHSPDAVDDLAVRIHTSACLRTRFRSKPISRAAGLHGWLTDHHGQVLLVWGEHDVTAVPAEAAVTLTQTCPGARSTVLPDAGHWVQYEAADLTNRLLLAWLDETNAVTTAKGPDMTERVHLEHDGDVAVIVIDNPPINAGSADVRRGLMSAIAVLQADDNLRAAILIGAGNSFIAGSDLREFGQPLEEPQLPAVIAAIEACGKPVVAALHGAALGGGFELALGCDARVASPGTVVGLPEVTLGIIPGAGGTQRLPRLVGVPRAIRMVCSGARVRSEEARSLGLVDELAKGDLREAAIRHARQLIGGKSLLRDRAVPAASTEEIEAASKDARRAGKSRPAVLAAIDAVASSDRLPFDQALANERQAFQALRISREARALRHQFFAERDAAKQPALANVSALPVQRVLVIGAGTMGSGIAIAALDAGFDVVLLEQDDAALQRGASRIQAHYAARVVAGKVDATAAAECEARLHPTTDWSTMANADMVIEAVFEDLAVKQAVFRQIDATARPGAVLATNTSYLDLNAIAAATSRPQDVVGLHFFSPANVMRLLEVVRGEQTAPEVLATGLEVAKRLRKLPVVTANAFGFIGNRIYSAYRRQCEFMLEEGALPEQVDAALEAFGFAMGPFAVADMSGLDIAWRMRQSQAATRDPAARYVEIPDRLCEAGRLGRKTGAGYYLYEGTTSCQPDLQVRAVIEVVSAAKGIARRPLDDSEIQRRALLTMVNEAALLLAEGVALRASDVDVVLVNGYGFPRWEGGPVFWARERGVAELRADLAWLAEVSGPGFIRGDVLHLLPSEA